MLILSRKTGETVVIDGRIRVKIIRVEGDVVKIGIDAPAEVSIHRQEVYDEIQRNNKEAATPDQPVVPKLPRHNSQASKISSSSSNCSSSSSDRIEHKTNISVLK